MKKALLLFIVFLFIAVGIFFFTRNRHQIIHPKRGEITEAVYGLGRVKSNKRFDVIIGVLSTVSRLYVDEGDNIKKGLPLVSFEHQSLFRAPFDGTVTLVRAREGETALPNTTILRFEDLKDRYIELTLEQQAALKLLPGQKAKISFESMRDKILTGQLVALYSRDNEFVAHIHVDGLPASVLPGMTADVTVEVGKVADAVLVPMRAIENNTITVKRDNRWQRIKVETGMIEGEMAQVKGTDLTPEDEIRIKR